MVSTIAVVPNTPPELGEDEHENIVAGVMLLQVAIQVVDPRRYVCPEAGLERHAVGVDIEAAVLRVNDAGAYVIVLLNSLSEALLAAGDTAGARRSAEQLVAIDPLSETAQRNRSPLVDPRA